MKIEANELNLKKLIGNEEVEKKEKKVKERDATSSEKDTVAFSEDLKKAEQKVIDILDYPDKRAEKIEEVKNMIKSGNYNVDVHKLTDKIIEDLVYGNFYQ